MLPFIQIVSIVSDFIVLFWDAMFSVDKSNTMAISLLPNMRWLSIKLLRLVHPAGKSPAELPARASKSIFCGPRILPADILTAIHDKVKNQPPHSGLLLPESNSVYICSIGLLNNNFFSSDFTSYIR